MTSLAKLLKEHEIKLTKPEAGKVYAINCPKSFCQKEREGSTDPADKAPLKVEILDEHHAKWKCDFCLWSDKVGEEPPEPPAPVEAVASWQEFLTSRGISLDVAKHAKVHWDTDKQAISVPNRAKPKHTAVTYYRLDGSSWYVSKKPTLYGVGDVQPGAPIVLAQNELDALMMATAGIPNVVALPNGGHVDDGSYPDGDPFDYIANAAEPLINAERVILATPNTGEGDRYRTELTRRIGPAKCYNVTYAKATPLATLTDLGIDGLCADINEATPCPILGLYELSDFERELMMYFDGGMAAGESTGWENVDHYYTVVPGQLTLVTGIPNTGKSEWLDALALNLADRCGWKIAAYSPENGKAPHATKLIEKKVMMPSDPKSAHRMSRDTYISGAQWVNQHFYFIAADSRKNAATIEWVLERGRDAVLRYGIKALIIDPFNRLRKSKDAPDNVDQYVAYVLDLILNFCEMHGVHVFLVAHPKTLESDRKTKKYPVPNAYDISGGANFFNMADNIIVLHRSEDIADATEVHVKKIRFKHVGKRTQIPPLLEYDISTGKYHEPEEGKARYSMAESEIQTIEPRE